MGGLMRRTASGLWVSDDRRIHRATPADVRHYRAGARALRVRRGYTGPGALAPIVYDAAVDWRAALGTDTVALIDGGKVPIARRSGNGAQPVTGSSPLNTQLVVIENPGTLGFPADMANVVQFSYDQQISQWVGGAGAGFGGYWFPAVAIGETQWMAYLLRNVLPDGVSIGGTDHGFETTITGPDGLPFFMHVTVGSSGKWDISFGTTAAGNNAQAEYGFTLEAGARLDKGHTYDIVIGRTRTGANTAAVQVHIYDESGTRVRTTTDFELDQPGATPSIPLESYEWVYADAAEFFRQWVMGASGQFGATYQGLGFYLGGFRVTRTREPGRYVAEDFA